MATATKPTYEELLKMLRIVNERYDELINHDATNHEFGCCMTDVENLLERTR
jgi:hypothetical protein